MFCLATPSCSMQVSCSVQRTANVHGRLHTLPVKHGSEPFPTGNKLSFFTTLNFISFKRMENGFYYFFSLSLSLSIFFATNVLWLQKQNLWFQLFKSDAESCGTSYVT